MKQIKTEVELLKELRLRRFSIARRITQTAVLLGLVASPLLGVVRLNLAEGSLLFLEHPIWAHEIQIIALGIGVSLIILALSAVLLGRSFCGWVCPQTTLCELTSFSVKGKTAEISPVRSAMRIVMVTVIGLGGGLVTMTFVMGNWPLGRLLSLPIDTSLLKGLTLITVLVAVDIGLLRHDFCEWMCLVGWWQRIFNNRSALRVSFNAKRGRECDHCSACYSTCFMGIDPRRRILPAHCLNCSRCVEACERHLANKQVDGLIHFNFPLGDSQTSDRFRQVAPRIGALCALFLLILVPFELSVQNRNSVQLTVRQTEPISVSSEGMLDGEFAIDIFNNSQVPASLSLTYEGLPLEGTVLSPSLVIVEPTGKYVARLRFQIQAGEVQPGLHSVRILAFQREIEKEYDAVFMFGVPPTSVAPEKRSARGQSAYQESTNQLEMRLES